VINFGVFFLLNTGIEVKLVRRMHKELQEKRDKLTKMNADKLCASADASLSADLILQERKREEEDIKRERKVIKMVIFNGFLNFILRASDVLFWIENTSVRAILKIDSLNTNIKLYAPGFFNLIADIGFFTYLCTFSTIFFIFYKFNKNFKEAVQFFWTAKKNTAN
jgi:hypothetical protein